MPARVMVSAFRLEAFRAHREEKLDAACLRGALTCGNTSRRPARPNYKGASSRQKSMIELIPMLHFRAEMLEQDEIVVRALV